MGKQYYISKLLVIFALCLLVGSPLQAQNRQLMGRITDAQGQPVAGANVLLRGTTRGVSTNNDGRFTLGDVPANATLVVSSVGYERQEVAVGDRSQLEVQLQADDQSLDEVVVVGYGTQKKVNLTGSVSVIDSKVIENRPVSNLATSLQGTTPGMIVTRQTGQPGQEGVDINIRGVTTANGSVPPLVIMDGVSVPASTLLTMNPNDVDNISVLKDAAAAAIYGAQAAGGVVIITTKRGTAGRVTFDYTTQLAREWTLNVPERMSLLEEAQYANLARLNSKASPEYSDQDLQYIKDNVPYVINPTDTSTYNYYNQQPLADQILKKFTFMQTHNISARGGTDKFNFLVSGGFYDKKGLFKLGPDHYSRYNFRVNLGAQLTRHLSLDARMAYTLEQTESTARSANGQSLIYEVYRLRTRTPFLTPEGRYNGANSAATTYAALEAGGYNKYNRHTFDGVFTLRASDVLVKGLNFQARYGLQLRPGYRRIFERVVELWGRTRVLRYLNNVTVNSYNKIFDLNTNTNFQGIADYNFDLGQKSHFALTAGYQWETTRFESVNTGVTNMVSNDLPTLNLGDDKTKTSSEGITEVAFQSVFGRLNYNYDNKYLFEATLRMDESSKLAPGMRVKTFPSASVGWNLHREDWFARTLPFFSEFKLRGSWGRLGGALGSGIGAYDYLNQLSRGSALVLGDSRASYLFQNSIPSSSLSWETIETSNAGLDLAFFRNKLQLSADYYVKYNRNMLTAQQLPSTIGINTAFKNNGELKSWGWEVEARYRNRIGKGFNYFLNANLSDNQNKLLSFSNRNIVGAGLNQYIEGYPLNTLWGYKTDGYFTTDDEVKAWAFQNALTGAGDVKYVDLDGDKRLSVGRGNVQDHGDLVLLGTLNPRYLFGVTLGADWRGFDFQIFVQGVGMRSFQPGQQSIAPLLVSWKQPLALHRDYWTPENPDALFPRPYAGGTFNYLPSDKWTLNARYARLKNIQVGYTLPARWTNRIKINRARIFLSGQDVLTVSAMKAFQKYYDPETRNGVENDYPFFGTMAMGLNLSF